MCSIFGIGLFKDHELKDDSALASIIDRLFRNAVVGGWQAAGLSIMREKSVHVLRRPFSATKLVESKEYKDFMCDNITLESKNNKVLSIIGHCRWPTKGSVNNNLNNHPIITDNIIGIHNGVISNDDSLFESFNGIIDREAEVDTEIIFQLVKHFNKSAGVKTIEAIKKTAPYLKGSYACAVQNTRHPYALHLFRHSNPIKILYYAEGGVVFFATREHFITEALDESPYPYPEYFGTTGEPIELVDNQGIGFNLWEKTMCKFLFRDWRNAKELKDSA